METPGNSSNFINPTKLPSASIKTKQLQQITPTNQIRRRRRRRRPTSLHLPAEWCNAQLNLHFVLHDDAEVFPLGRIGNSGWWRWWTGSRQIGAERERENIKVKLASFLILPFRGGGGLVGCGEKRDLLSGDWHIRRRGKWNRGKREKQEGHGGSEKRSHKRSMI